MASPEYQVIITSDEEKGVSAKRRAAYIRPFFLFWLSSFIAEVVFLMVGIFIMTGTRDLIYKVLWTLLFCPFGMGGAMGGIIDYFIVDHYYGNKAVYFTALISILVFGSCNYLCYNLDRHFGWFGAAEHPLWFHWRYPMIYAVGWWNGKLLFTDEGQKKLAAWGL
ncbi:hypothetical protein M432DRAFT_611057 [Thermoascus aurantiacus ATCC 26904]